MYTHSVGMQPTITAYVACQVSTPPQPLVLTNQEICTWRPYFQTGLHVSKQVNTVALIQIPSQSCIYCRRLIIKGCLKIPAWVIAAAKLFLRGLKQLYCSHFNAALKGEENGSICTSTCILDSSLLYTSTAGYPAIRNFFANLYVFFQYII